MSLFPGPESAVRLFVTINHLRTYLLRASHDYVHLDENEQMVPNRTRMRTADGRHTSCICPSMGATGTLFGRNFKQ